MAFTMSAVEYRWELRCPHKENLGKNTKLIHSHLMKLQKNHPYCWPVRPSLPIFASHYPQRTQSFRKKRNCQVHLTSLEIRCLYCRQSLLKQKHRTRLLFQWAETVFLTASSSRWGESLNTLLGNWLLTWQSSHVRLHWWLQRALQDGQAVL